MTRPDHNPEPVGDILPRVLDGTRPESITTTPGEPATSIVVTFTPVKGTDPVAAVRRMLKHAGRMCGLRCVSLTASGWPGIEPLASTPTKKEPLT